MELGCSITGSFGRVAAASDFLPQNPKLSSAITTVTIKRIIENFLLPLKHKKARRQIKEKAVNEIGYS